MRTIAHEFDHALAVKFYRDGAKSNSSFSEFKSNVDSLYQDAMAGLAHREIESVISGSLFDGITYGDVIKLLAEGKSVREVSEHFFDPKIDAKKTNEFKFSIYWMKNPLDFMAEMHSRPAIQKLMASVAPSVS